MDICLANLATFSRDKAFSHAIRLTKGKTTHRTCFIASQHKESLKILNETVLSPGNDTGNWFVLSGNGQHKHDVTIVSTCCTQCSKLTVVHSSKTSKMYRGTSENYNCSYFWRSMQFLVFICFVFHEFYVNKNSY